MKIPFGKPFPAIDSTSLRDGVAAGLVNGFINELDDYESMPGHTLFATRDTGDPQPVEGLYETLSGVVLGVTDGIVVRVNSDGTLTELTGGGLAAGNKYYYFAEDGQHVYVAHGGKLSRLDMTNLTVTHLNENSPSAVTHVVRSKGFLLCNGNDRIMSSSPFELSQVFDNTGQLTGVVTLTDKPGWILMSGSRTTTPGNGGSIYLSKDNGLNWTKIDPVGGGGNDFVMCLCYMGAGIVLAGTGIVTGRILRSTDYGQTWADLGQQGSSTLINFIAKVDINIAIAGSGSGAGLGEIYRTTNNGASWTNIATPTNFGKQVSSCIVWSTSIVTVGAVNATDVAHIWRSTDAGATFTDVATLDAAALPIDGVMVSTTVGLMSVSLGTSGKIYRSTDTGSTWATIGTIPELEVDAIPYAFLETFDGDLLFGTAGNNLGTGGAQIWKSTDEGVTWHEVLTLDSSKEAMISARSMAETHTPGQIIVAGRTLLPNSTAANAAKWQTGIGRNAPQGDVFYSEDVSNNYEAVDSWGRFNAQSVADACNGVFEHRAWVYSPGPRSVEINYNAPDAEFPWQVSDPSLPFGLLAPFSWVEWDELDTIMYLTNTDKGVKVVQFRGRQQQGISQEYDAVLNDAALVSAPEDAKAWGITVRGLPFYVISFPASSLTLVYNVSKDHWFRWAYWNGSTYEAALINCYCYSATMKKHFIGDRRSNGKIYTMDVNSLTDDGSAIRFELTSGWVSRATDAAKFIARFLAKFKRGGATDSSEPQVTLTFRDDGRANFGADRTGSLGLTGATEFYLNFNRLGMYRARQYRLVALLTKTRLIFSGADES